MVHITVIQACPLAHSLSGGRAGCPRGSCPAGWLGKQSLQKPGNPGQAAGEWRREMRRDISALQGSGRLERGVGGGRDGEGKAAFHPLSELLREELLPEPCCSSLLEMLKEKQKGEGGMGAGWKVLDPGSEPVCTCWGKSWKQVGEAVPWQHVWGQETASGGASDCSPLAVAPPAGTPSCSGKGIPSIGWQARDQSLIDPKANLQIFNERYVPATKIIKYRPYF